jgi:hypothetical protein
VITTAAITTANTTAAITTAAIMTAEITIAARLRCRAHLPTTTMVNEPGIAGA